MSYKQDCIVISLISRKLSGLQYWMMVIYGGGERRYRDQVIAPKSLITKRLQLVSFSGRLWKLFCNNDCYWVMYNIKQISDYEIRARQSIINYVFVLKICLTKVTHSSLS